MEWGVISLEACKQLCAANSTCVGIEYNSGALGVKAWKKMKIMKEAWMIRKRLESRGGRRCEIWVRPEGIEVTKPADGYICLKYLPNAPDPSTKGKAKCVFKSFQGFSRLAPPLQPAPLMRRSFNLCPGMVPIKCVAEMAQVGSDRLEIFAR